MINGKRDYYSDCYKKYWDPVFSTDRNFKEDEPYVEYKRGINADGDDFDIFLQDSEDSVPSSKVGEVKELCQDARLDDLKKGTGTAGTRRGAWLDDRSCPSMMSSSRCIRKYHNPLTATGLYQLLKESRFDNPDTPDANRRLIYITNLDPYYILALTETASFRQVSVLRDAFWKHVALQTSIRVKIPPRGFPLFQLEFHLSYFALRLSPPPKEPPRNGNPPRTWTDLSFLKVPSPKSHNERKYGIYKAQISLVISGSDDRRWVAYAFVDTDFDSKELGNNEDFSYEGVQEDPIASDDKIDANRPIWSPREYFLMIVETRMDQVRTEWESLVRTVERSINGYGGRHSFTLLQQPRTTGDRAEDVKETFDWTQQTITLLSQLLGVLSETIRAWERFNSSNGDVSYFSNIDSSDISQRRTCRSLPALKETFEVLEDLQQKLLRLEKDCRDLAQTLQLRLTLEGSRAAQHNGLATELTVSVISPITLATAYFSMPRAVIPFNLNSKSFLIAIFVAMVTTRLLFIVLGVFLRWPWWWKKITARIKAIQLDGIVHSLSISGYDRRLALRRGRNSPDEIIDGVEMETVGV